MSGNTTRFALCAAALALGYGDWVVWGVLAQGAWVGVQELIDWSESTEREEQNV